MTRDKTLPTMATVELREHRGRENVFPHHVPGWKPPPSARSAVFGFPRPATNGRPATNRPRRTYPPRPAASNFESPKVPSSRVAVPRILFFFFLFWLRTFVQKCPLHERTMAFRHCRKIIIHLAINVTMREIASRRERNAVSGVDEHSDSREVIRGSR